MINYYSDRQFKIPPEQWSATHSPEKITLHATQKPGKTKLTHYTHNILTDFFLL